MNSKREEIHGIEDANMKKVVNVALLLMAFFLLLIGMHARAGEHAVPKPCGANLTLPENVRLRDDPAWQDTAGLPRYCRVRGKIGGRVGFEMRLPEKWNGRFMMAGCGGFCGQLLPDKEGYSNAINEALKLGYAAISQDGGHSGKSWDASFAVGDPDALALYAHKVLPVVANAGTAIATAFYQQSPRYKYYSGCSNGGRLGMMAAQRYPDLFDGIAAGGSIFDLSGNAGLWGNWLAGLAKSGGKYLLPREKLPFLKHEVMQRCDSSDGQVDGVISNPGACHVDFRTMQCGSESEAVNQCLTSTEARMLNTLYGGVKNREGKTVYPVLRYGAEHYGDIWLFGSEAAPSWGVLAANSYRKLLMHSVNESDPDSAITTDAMQTLIARSSLPALTDAVDTDLSGLNRNHTKLLMYQGLADPLIIPDPIVGYYRKAVANAGSLSALKRDARLFMVPGMGHCWEKSANAPDVFDPLVALQQWVEENKAPDYLVAKQVDDSGEVVRTRPVCAYPKLARLIEAKFPDKWQSYRCEDL
ncbi:tannase/feruloyl esterase family alpha/beta hydrolase [Microbulbifer spongiae]|uniref:Tannase/feruloyl esterase family alpha/beta hydrolase n=1 Tax=Microbulbifer spongiae TaxID=2944933 RepID=A0ABY9EH93_9GAMM|nr:tannase/feruloyl esterase family alpha/beta hydrolase [Microbulbifer sp. MI-G]WKD51528.1 tannase/feruloyl esterase family alpha/beta hydrolase [Microbulbifer sp. MI-G]